MLGGAAHSQNLGPEYLDECHRKAQEYVEQQRIHKVGVGLMLTERCRCLMYKVTVEYAYVERAVIMDSGYAVLGLNTVAALVQVLGVFVLTGVVDVLAVLWP